MDDTTLGYILIAAIIVVVIIASVLVARRMPPKGERCRTSSVKRRSR